MRKLLIIIPALVIAGIASAQDCTVKATALTGTYEGGCKKGIADGNGTATGEDKYTGEFKSGLPNGHGMYTWKNGDWYEGRFEKGLRSGDGTMHYADKPAYDTLHGFWKKDKYVGRFEHPYTIESRSNGISKIDVDKTSGSSLNEITIYAESITGGATIGNGGTIPRPKISSVEVVKGAFVQQFDQDLSVKRTATTLRMVQYPFRARVTIDSDVLEFEILEEGKWTIELKLQR